ncbi:MAG TPA: cell division protein FtsA [Opitutaceae bacterium]|nr:cell division protein FtsA [Opitutaceae bacterium]
MSSKTTFIGAVEIGTSKIVALVGEYTGREIVIIGCGECASRGVIKGSVVDYRAATECTQTALELAERDANERIDHVYLAQTGGHLEGFYNEASLNVKAADNMIEKDDIRTVCELAKAKDLPLGRMVVHNIRRPFRVDGRLVPTSPENLVGQKLEVGYWTVHGQEQRLADNIHVIRGFNLEVSELVLSSLASGHMVTGMEERQNGVVAIDIGAGTTDFVLYRNGVPHTTGVLAVGGDHFTNDISIGLRLTKEQAEKLKLRFGRAVVQAREKSEKVWLDGNFSIGDRQFPRQAIEQITAARAWELLDVVKRELGHAFAPETCAAGVVLTGGAAKLPALALCAAKVFGTPARLGEAPSWVNENLRDPGYHTALGTLYYGMSVQGDRAVAARTRVPFLRNVTRLFAST